MASASPRTRLTSSCDRLRLGTGRRTRLPVAPLPSAAKLTSTSGVAETARTAAAVARLKVSIGLSPSLMRRPPLVGATRTRRLLRRLLGRAAAELAAEAALEIFRHDRPLDLVAFVE